MCFVNTEKNDYWILEFKSSSQKSSEVGVSFYPLNVFVCFGFFCLFFLTACMQDKYGIP